MLTSQQKLPAPKQARESWCKASFFKETCNHTAVQRHMTSHPCTHLVQMGCYRKGAYKAQSVI